MTSTHSWGTQPEMFGPRHQHRLGRMLAALAPLPRGARVLDAACGLGQLAQRLAARGLNAFGVDGEIAAAMEAQRAGVRVVVADMTYLPFRDAAFDAITSGETLEHLDNDAAGLREIARLLRDGARCVMTVPAFEWLWSASDDYYEHRRRYARRELAAMTRSAGLDVVRARYWGFPAVLTYDTFFILPMNRLRARRGEGIPAVARAGRSHALVGIVRAIFAIDRLFGWLPFGPGLLVVAEKRGRGIQSPAVEG